MDTTPTIVRAFIVWRGAVLLLCRAIDDDVRPGEWDLPGGAVEVAQGETVVQGCIREVMEETGLTLTQEQVYEAPGLDDFQRPDRIRCVCIVRLDSAVEPEIVLNDEHSQYMWCPIDRMRAMYHHPFYMVAFDQVVERAQ